MSYRVGTTHYNLPQTEGTDKRDWADTNQAFADLDAAVYEAGSDAGLALSAAQAAQTSADGAVADAASAVTTANAASASASSASEAAALARTEAQGAVTTANAADATAQAAQTTASNADTVALRAEGKADTANGNIGTMANLQTTDKTSLVAAINEVLSQIGGGSMPALNFATPLHTFTTGSLTYTATADCYLCGSINPTGSGGGVTLTINSVQIANAYPSNMFISPLKLSAGDVVVASAEASRLHVYSEVQ